MQRPSGKGACREPNTGARAVSLAIVAVLVMGAFGLLVGTSGRAAAYTAYSEVEPNPAIEGNVTATTHIGADGALSYTNLAGNVKTLAATVDTRVKNPYSVDPADLQSSGVLQGERIDGDYWNSTTAGVVGTTNTAGWLGWTGASLGTGATHVGPTAVTVNKLEAVQFTTNSSHKDSGSAYIHAFFSVPTASLPSTNLAFDYVTMAGTIASPTLSGITFALAVANVSTVSPYTVSFAEVGYYTGNGTTSAAGVTTGATYTANPSGATVPFYLSAPLSRLTSSSVNLATAKSLDDQFGVQLNLPVATSTTITLTVTAVSVGTTGQSLGPTYWAHTKANVTRGVDLSSLNLSSLKPTISAWSTVASGYTVAIQQQADQVANVTITEASFSNGSEQVTYTLPFGLPTAPTLSYGSFKLIGTSWLKPWQYVSVTFGGSSLLSAYQDYADHAKVQVMESSVNPNTAQNWQGTVIYTEAQWLEISHAPGLFSESGLAYEFWVLVGIVGGLFTLGGAVVFAKNRQAGLRIR